MPEAIADTGPVLHLQEIGRLQALSPVAPLIFPNLVVDELAARGIVPRELQLAGIESTVVPVASSEWEEVLLEPDLPRLQPADAQVFVLVRARRFQALALTDDLALRKLLEGHGATVAGSIGVLVRAYRHGSLQRSDLEESINRLMTRSSLHLSRAFRLYVQKLLVDLA